MNERVIYNLTASTSITLSFVLFIPIPTGSTTSTTAAADDDDDDEPIDRLLLLRRRGGGGMFSGKAL